MAFLIASDIHSSVMGLEKLGWSCSNGSFDCVFLLGDYSAGLRDRPGNMEDVRRVMDVFSGVDLFMLAGNCDQRDSVKWFGRHNLHGRRMQAGGVVFAGFGGSNKTPFGTPFELAEQEIYEGLKSAVEGLDPGFVLLTHCPPVNTACDRARGGRHVGSSGVRRVIEEYEPSFCFSGHIHEAGGMSDWIGDCRVVNVGCLQRGSYVVFSPPEFEVF